MKALVYLFAISILVTTGSRTATADAQQDVEQIGVALKNAAEAVKVLSAHTLRTNLEWVQGAIDGADAELRAHAAFPKIVDAHKKLAALLPQVEKLEIALDAARPDLRLGHNNYESATDAFGRDAASEALGYYKECASLHQRVLKTTPGLAAIKHPESSYSSGHTIQNVLDACNKGIKDAQAWASGGGRDPARDNPRGKEMMAGYNAAVKLAPKKQLDVMQLFAARKAVGECTNGYGDLMAIKNARTNNHYYDQTKEKLPVDGGELTLEQIGKQCKAWEKDLASRKAKGCGYLEMGVFQQLLVRPSTWGNEDDGIGMGWMAAKCTGMPKKAKTTGIPKKYLAQFKANCKGGILVSDRNTWSPPYEDSDGRVMRSVNTKCWAKGELNFYGIAPE